MVVRRMVITFQSISALNPNCTGPAGKLGHPVTVLFYLAVFAVCVTLTFLTYWKYNSVTVLNLVVRTRSISNILWIAYFFIASARALLNSVVYAVNVTSTCDQDDCKDIFIIADNVLKALQVFLLVLALNYQRKYRSGGFLEGEVARFNRHTEFHWDVKTCCALYVLSSETIFIIQFFATLGLLISLEVVGRKNSNYVAPLYWAYVGALWSMSVAAVVLVILVVKATTQGGPNLKTKLLFLGGVLLSLPTDIPVYVWTNCISCKCHTMSYLTCYDLFVIISIFCAIAFFAALRREFLRLNQEVRWNAVSHVESIITSSHDSHSHSALIDSGQE